MTLGSAARALADRLEDLRLERLRRALGVLWLVDGLLQLQPYMLGPAFFRDVMGMANMGLPHPFDWIDFRVTGVFTAHPLGWDLVLAVIQIALGLGIITTRFRRLALAASIPWGVAVWIVGEGLGGLFMPGVSMLNGAPGAALLYVVAALVLWPADGNATGAVHALSRRWVIPAWSGLWLSGALLELLPASRASGVPAGEILQAAYELPAPFHAVARSTASVLETHGLAFALVAATLELGVAVLAFSGSSRRGALLLGGSVALVFWVVGQAFGGLGTGRATDVGAGPLWILLAVSVWTIRPAPVLDAQLAAVGPDPARQVELTPHYAIH